MDSSLAVTYLQLESNNDLSDLFHINQGTKFMGNEAEGANFIAYIMSRCERLMGSLSYLFYTTSSGSSICI